MRWESEAIVVRRTKFGNTSMIFYLLTPNFGVASGVVKGVLKNKRLRAITEGSVVDSTWVGRLEDNLGYFSLDLKFSTMGLLISKPLRLQALASTCDLLYSLIKPQEESLNIYQSTRKLLSNFAEDNWLFAYLQWLYDLLSLLGFGINLNECAFTGAKGAKNLHYLSPKTGKSTSQEIGKKWHKNLFEIPNLLKAIASDNKSYKWQQEDYLPTFKILEFFLKKNVAENLGEKHIPKTFYLFSERLDLYFQEILEKNKKGYNCS